jgi:hypothetical protein
MVILLYPGWGQTGRPQLHRPDESYEPVWPPQPYFLVIYTLHVLEARL